MRVDEGHRARLDVAGELDQALVNRARPQDMNLYTAADWTTEQLRDAALRIADHLHSLMRRGMPAGTGRSD